MSIKNRNSQIAKLTYCFDIDGTLCKTNGMDYKISVPFKNVIKIVNKLHSNGNKIILYTARGSLTGIDWLKVTKKQLKSWGVKYDKLVMGKPPADIYIDDKCMDIKDFMKNKGRYV